MKRFIINITLMLMSIGCLSAQNALFHGADNAANSRVKAPEWVTPIVNEGDTAGVAAMNAMFVWTPAIINGTPAVNYTSTFTVVQLMPGQAPDDAIRRNPKVFEKRGLSAPQCLVPVNVARTMATDAVYAAQITVSRFNGTPRGNEIKSPLLIFTVNSPNNNTNSNDNTKHK